MTREKLGILIGLNEGRGLAEYVLKSLTAVGPFFNHRPQVGETVTCCETGKPFVIARSGCSFNYATDHLGFVFSDEGVHIREMREVEARHPLGAYLSGDGKSITGWKGNKLLVVLYATKGNRGRMTYVRAVDHNGFEWYGRGLGAGWCITMRPAKVKLKD